VRLSSEGSTYRTSVLEVRRKRRNIERKEKKKTMDGRAYKFMA
jgi:hypothetical protein